MVDHGGRSGDEIEVILAFEAFLNDLHVEQAKKPTAKAKAESLGGFRLKGKRSIVEAEFFEGFAQIFVVGGFDRVEAAKDHRFDFFKSAQRLDTRALRKRDRVSDSSLRDIFDTGGDKADLAARKLR